MFLAAGLVGCNAEGDGARFQSRMIPDADPDSVARAAEVVLRREFGRLASESTRRRLLTEPHVYSTTSDSGAARDLYRGPSTLRSIATLLVTSRDSGSLTQVRVDVEREDTARSEAFQPESYRLSDAPSRTALERDAATSTRQNTVWTFVKRDRKLERAILDEIADRLGGPTPSAGEGATPANDTDGAKPPKEAPKPKSEAAPIEPGKSSESQ